MAAPLLNALTFDNARVKFGAAKELRALSELDPEALYPHFDSFAALLHHENSILRWNAMLILGNLARIDRAGRIDGVLDDLLRPIDGPQLIDAANAIHAATAIAAFKPHLADRIAARIMDLKRATYGTAECRNVALGHAIAALAHLYEMLADQRGIAAFIERQASNPRPATRKKAEAFLRRHPSGGRVH